MKDKKTIHIPTGLHEEFKKECKKRGLVLQYHMERMIIRQLDEWMIEERDNQQYGQGL